MKRHTARPLPWLASAEVSARFSTVADRRQRTTRYGGSPVAHKPETSALSVCYRMAGNSIIPWIVRNEIDLKELNMKDC
jgi:hypothetical protein